jgi:eukaryotic-like serine/threonine-protein kinase
MQCPLCQAENPPTAISCAKCSTPFPLDDRTLGATVTGGTAPPSATPRGTSAWSVAVTPPPDAPYAQGEALIGTLLAERYEILELLGQGGMGAVYKAHDIELERLVALKLIRPDLASNPEILRRFKQELILAREVTHRNVIRIFDLGQAKGFKFITMEFVEGRDLRAILRERGKLPPEEAVRIISQVCRALESAHAAGVVHRDLKPQNIMMDAKDRVYVMDFGIAHSLETPGMTQTGALMGTPEYMSPEQAKGIKVDPRSDLFSLGIIFYELLTGISPFKADTALATLLKRTQERAQPPAEVDPTIPKAISDVVMKCLEIDRDLRFSNAREILEDLGQEMPTSVRTVAPTLPPLIPTPKAGEISPFVRYRTWIAGGAAVVLLAGLGFAFRGKIFPAKRAAPVEQASLAILPFRNASGDASLDWLGPSLADMLSTDVGQSARLRTISPDRLHQVLSDLKITPNAAIDPTTVGRIAEFSSADTVVWGQYAKFGDQIRIDATLLDLKHNRRAPLKIESASEKEIPATVDGLAELIRKNLSLSSDVLKELKASSFQPSSKSVPALRDYDRSLQLLREGKNLEAVKTLQAAVQADPQFALAYSRLAETESALGYDTEAEKYSRKALELSQQLPLAERYLIEANHARIMKDNKKAIEAYENLAKTSPGNNDIQYALGNLYLDVGDLEKARAHYSDVLKVEPKNLDALIQMGWLEVQSGRPQSGLDPLNRALSLAVEVDNQEQKAQVLQAIGMAYEAMNKFDEALRNLEQARDINSRLGKKAGLANSLVEIANVQSSLGKPEVALAGYTQALNLRREIGAKRDTANTLIAMGALFASRGQSDKALQMFKESLQIQRDIGDEPNQALCLNNIGAVYEEQGKYDDALTYYQQSLQLREKLGVPADIADTLHNQAAVYSKTAQYDQAMASYMRALDIRHKGADNRAAALESDGIGLVFLSQGRLGAAVSSLQEAVKGFREAKDRSEDMAQILNDFAKALAKAGRGAEAAKVLEEALGLAGELKNDKLMSDVLNTQGDVLFYRGDLKAAKSLYQQGLQVASRAKAQDNILLLRLNLAEVAIAEGRSQSAFGDLQAILVQADSLNLRYLSLRTSVDMAEAMISTKDYSHARQGLDRAMGTSEKLGVRMETARIRYLLGNLLRLTGNGTEAGNQYQQAITLLDDIKKEPGAEHVMDRSDLHTIYTEASRWSAGGKS